MKKLLVPVLGATLSITPLVAQENSDVNQDKNLVNKEVIDTNENILGQVDKILAGDNQFSLEGDFSGKLKTGDLIIVSQSGNIQDLNAELKKVSSIDFDGEKTLITVKESFFKHSSKRIFECVCH